MANKILTFIFDTVEPELDAIIAAAIDEIHKAGHTIKEIRVADDSGEEKVPANQVAGVTVPEPVTAIPAPEPEPEPEPADPTPVDPPVDTPADPTEVTAPVDATVPDPSSTDSTPA